MSEQSLRELVAQFTGNQRAAEALVHDLDEIELKDGLKEEIKKKKKE